MKLLNMSFQRVLEKYRTISFSEKDKGFRFERLMQAFLQTVPWYEGILHHVWLWNEFPYKQNIGGKDTGIDLVPSIALLGQTLREWTAESFL